MSAETNHFALFGLEPRFAIDLDELTRRYRDLQQAVHPDRYASASDAERRLSMQRSVALNEALQVLRDPLQRARHLLALRGLEWEDEYETRMDPAFLMQQMEWREALGGARKAADPLEVTGRILDEVTAERRRIIARLGELLDGEGAPEEAKGLILQLQFLGKLIQEAEALEAELEEI